MIKPDAMTKLQPKPTACTARAKIFFVCNKVNRGFGISSDRSRAGEEINIYFSDLPIAKLYITSTCS